MAYLKILSAWIAVFSLPIICSDYYPTGSLWFLTNSSLSFFLFWYVLSVEKSKLTAAISYFELTAMLIILLALYGFMHGGNFFYNFYEYLLLFVNVAEGCLLIFWMPRNGITRSINRLWGSLSDLFRNRYISVQINQVKT